MMGMWSVCYKVRAIVDRVAKSMRSFKCALVGPADEKQPRTGQEHRP